MNLGDRRHLDGTVALDGAEYARLRGLVQERILQRMAIFLVEQSGLQHNVILFLVFARIMIRLRRARV